MIVVLTIALLIVLIVLIIFNMNISTITIKSYYYNSIILFNSNSRTIND